MFLTRSLAGQQISKLYFKLLTTTSNLKLFHPALKMVEYRGPSALIASANRRFESYIDFKPTATLTLVPTFTPRRMENFPGNFPSSGEAELLDEAEELARVKQIKEDTRELVFMPEKKTFQIGRASSNPHKGLMAARDNAFFLSPVMSRYHAEVQMIEKNVRPLPPSIQPEALTPCNYVFWVPSYTR